MTPALVSASMKAVRANVAGSSGAKTLSTGSLSAAMVPETVITPSPVDSGSETEDSPPATTVCTSLATCHGATTGVIWIVAG